MNLPAADAFYEKELASRVMAFADRARSHGAAVLAADPGRKYLPRSRLTPLAGYDVPGLAALEDSECKHTTVWSPLGGGENAASRDAGAREPGWGYETGPRLNPS
jgi:hypothetical protein